MRKGGRKWGQISIIQGDSLFCHYQKHKNAAENRAMKPINIVYALVNISAAEPKLLTTATN